MTIHKLSKLFLIISFLGSGTFRCNSQQLHLVRNDDMSQKRNAIIYEEQNSGEVYLLNEGSKWKSNNNDVGITSSYKGENYLSNILHYADHQKYPKHLTLRATSVINIYHDEFANISSNPNWVMYEQHPKMKIDNAVLLFAIRPEQR